MSIFDFENVLTYGVRDKGNCKNTSYTLKLNIYGFIKRLESLKYPCEPPSKHFVATKNAVTLFIVDQTRFIGSLNSIIRQINTVLNISALCFNTHISIPNRSALDTTLCDKVCQ